MDKMIDKNCLISKRWRKENEEKNEEREGVTQADMNM